MQHVKSFISVMYQENEISLFASMRRILCNKWYK